MGPFRKNDLGQAIDALGKQVAHLSTYRWCPRPVARADLQNRRRIAAQFSKAGIKVSQGEGVLTIHFRTPKACSVKPAESGNQSNGGEETCGSIGFIFHARARL
jgi:hypothetical protein